MSTNDTIMHYSARLRLHGHRGQKMNTHHCVWITKDAEKAEKAVKLLKDAAFGAYEYRLLLGEY